MLKDLDRNAVSPQRFFLIYVEEALKIWKENCRGMGLNVNGTSIFTLQFSDDPVIIARIKEDLEKMTIQIKEEYEKWGHLHER